MFDRYDRQDPQGGQDGPDHAGHPAAPAPYLPAWLDATPVHGGEPQPYEPQAYDVQVPDPQAYGEYVDGAYVDGAYGGRGDPGYLTAEPIGWYGADPAPASASDRALPARVEPSGAAGAVPAAGRAARRPRRRLGSVARVALAGGLVAFLGVFGYWGWSYYQGDPRSVQEGDCIAALTGDDIRPASCQDPNVKFQVQEIFTNTADTGACTSVLGATNPLVVKRDGRSDVWCVGPK